MRLLKRGGPGQPWQDVSGDWSWDRGARTFTKSGASSFSEYAIGEASSPLPVELAGFDGAVTEDGVQLRWKTASEQNNAGFRVLRTNGAGTDPAGEWTKIGFVEGSGTTADAQAYRFTDTDLPYDADSVSYRLRQVDTDGTERLTDPVTVARDGPDQLELLNTAPNPARRRATVRFAIPEGTDAETVEMRLYDVLGRQVRTVRAKAEPGRHKQRLDVGASPAVCTSCGCRPAGQPRPSG